jgi:signal peptidase II
MNLRDVRLLADEADPRYVASMPERWKIFAAIVLAIAVLDQWTKLLAVKHLTPGFAVEKLIRETGERPKRPPSREQQAEILDRIGFAENLSIFFSDGIESPCSDRGARCPHVKVIDGFWGWRYAENPGAAWSVFATVGKGLRVPFLVSVSLLAFCFIIYYVKKLPSDQKLTLLALSLIGGGAIGNVIDRIRLHYVVDFIVWYQGTTQFPTFNVADSAITCGVALIGLTLVLEIVQKRRTKDGGTLGEPDAVR